MDERPRRRLFGPLLYVTLALTALVGFARALVLFSQWWPAEYEFVYQLPAPVLASVREAVPGYEPESITKRIYDATDAYQIDCRDKRGKYREVWISMSGKIIWITQIDP